MRDKLKDINYFEEYIKLNNRSILRGITMLQDDKVSDNKINSFKDDIFIKKLRGLIASYSLGDNIESLKQEYYSVLMYLRECWSGEIVKIRNDRDQYLLEPHGRMLRMLSLGYLLDIADEDFQVLVDIIDRDNISDNLYEFIIKARFPDRKQKRPEEYDTEHSVILKVYDKLRKAIEQDNKEEASKLVKQFLDKGFYHKHIGFYNAHKKNYNLYFGYWSFEAAAVVKIMELDDSCFIGHQYYPKDLVHKNPEESKKGFFKKLGFKK